MTSTSCLLSGVERTTVHILGCTYVLLSDQSPRPHSATSSNSLSSPDNHSVSDSTGVLTYMRYHDLQVCVEMNGHRAKEYNPETINGDSARVCWICSHEGEVRMSRTKLRPCMYILNKTLLPGIRHRRHQFLSRLCDMLQYTDRWPPRGQSNLSSGAKWTGRWPIRRLLYHPSVYFFQVSVHKRYALVLD